MISLTIFYNNSFQVSNRPGRHLESKGYHIVLPSFCRTNQGLEIGERLLLIPGNGGSNEGHWLSFYNTGEILLGRKEEVRVGLFSISSFKNSVFFLPFMTQFLSAGVISHYTCMVRIQRTSGIQCPLNRPHFLLPEHKQTKESIRVNLRISSVKTSLCKCIITRLAIFVPVVVG